ncbi:MAG: hypothetical protein K0U20_09230 [Proteobacteria bacterium]|nr:hypothetical protein [Pseudomonadota bacterium]MCH9735763.1 hypothetical protein [Actinomycetes bacterium]
MAYTNNNTTQRTYSTEPEEMLKEAKQMAKREFTTTKAVIERLGQKIDDEIVAEALIQVKYDQIVNARTKRVTYFD